MFTNIITKYFYFNIAVKLSIIYLFKFGSVKILNKCKFTDLLSLLINVMCRKYNVITTIYFTIQEFIIK